MFLRLIIAILATLAILCTAAVLYLSFADLNWMKPRIESAALDATGRTLEMRGNFDIDIIPAPAITIEDVSFSNADWGSEPEMVELGHFSVKADLWSLLSGPIRILSLRLEDVDLLLERNADLQANWELSQTDANEAEVEHQPAQSDGLPVIVESLEIRNFNTTYLEPESEPTTAALSVLDISLDGDSHMVIQANGEVAEQALKLVGRLGPEKALVDGRDIEISLDPELGEHKLKIDGTLDLLADDLRLHQWMLKYQGAEILLDGEVARNPSANSRFDIAASGSSLAKLDGGLPPIAFKTAMGVTLAPKEVLLDDIKSSIGESDLSGNLKVSLGPKTTVSGELTSQSLDLTPFAGEQEAAGKEKPEAAKKARYVFKEEPLQLDGLHAVDLELATSVGRLKYQNAMLKDVVTDLSLKDGQLHLKNTFSGTGEGRAVSSVKLLAAADSRAELDVDVRIRDLRVNLLSGDKADVSLIPPMNVTVDIEAAGATPRALAKTSKGRILLSQEDGKIESGVVGLAAGDTFAQLFKALNPFAEEEKYTSLDCTVIGLDLAKSKADFSGLLFQTEKVKAMGDGGIDLATEDITLELETQPRKGIGITPDMFVTPFVELGGTLASPAVSMNKKGVILKGGAAIATGGLSLLAEGAADRQAGAEDRCATVLEETGGHPPIGK